MSKNVMFTFPGKIGDAFHQWPIAYHWAKENQQKITVGLDRNSLSGVKALFAAQKCVKGVELLDGVTGYQCGGQPWGFGGQVKWDGPVIHLGFHFMPNEQLTYFVRRKMPIVGVEDKVLEEEQSLWVGKRLTQSRVLIHAQALCPHTRKPPALMGVLQEIAPILDKHFAKKMFVGVPNDIPAQRPQGWGEMKDGGAWLQLARYVNNSALVIGVGSSIVALAGALKVPCIRIHDKLGGESDLDYRIWNNLGSNQLNLYRPAEGYKEAIETFMEAHCGYSRESGGPAVDS